MCNNQSRANYLHVNLLKEYQFVSVNMRGQDDHKGYVIWFTYNTRRVVIKIVPGKRIAVEFDGIRADKDHNDEKYAFAQIKEYCDGLPTPTPFIQHIQQVTTDHV